MTATQPIRASSPAAPAPAAPRPGAQSPLRAAIDALLQRADADGASPVQRRLAEGFFRRSDEVYLLQRELASVWQQWRDFADWILRRNKGEIAVRVFNPSKEKNGYELNRTVLQTCMEDQPFLFDTLRQLLLNKQVPPHRCIHPILGAKRDALGNLVDVDPLPKEPQGLESTMHFELPRIEEPERRAEIEEEVRAALHRVQAVVADFVPMRNKALWLAGHLSDFVGQHPSEYYRHVAMVQKFLHWLVDDNFVLIGYEEFEVSRDDARRATPTPVPESRLGLARVDASRPEQPFPDSARTWLDGSEILFLGKGEREAGVHRPGKTDHVAARLVQGSQERVVLFTGLYTHKAISEEVTRIPILREKLETVLKSQAAVPGSHLERKLEQAFRALPVEFLFGADAGAIEEALQLVMSAEEEQQTGAHVRVDAEQRSAFVLVSLPRDRYDDDVRQAAGKRLLDVMGANYMDWRIAFGQAGSVVLQFYVTAADRFRQSSEAAIEAAVAAVTGSWREQLVKILRSRQADEAEAEALVGRYVEAFPDEYEDQSDPAEAADDVALLEQVRGTGRLAVAVAPAADDVVSGVTRLKIYQREKIYLTDSTPVLHNFGLQVIDQSSVTLSLAGEETAWIDTFRVKPRKKAELDEPGERQRLVEGLEATLGGRNKDDNLNELTLTAGLSWREVNVLRGYLAFGRQLGATDSVELVNRTWRGHAQAAGILLKLFRSRFKPGLGAADDGDRMRLVERNKKAFLEYVKNVEQVAEDRILRRSFNYVMATLRTNFWAGAELDGHPVSFKFDCAQIEDMPTPRPMREIFVHHLNVDGVHLRGGPVARGGIRFSDRPADYRREVLGLMDTQMLKNVLIVPVGAKGGFILKQAYETPAETRRAGDTYYKVFIRGLLDLTDNVVDGHVVPPAEVIRYDGDDPYLVVAADKGTAHLSDTANGIAKEYGFWLGDAFASGGSQGYDHKAYGITAKGGWMCVRRHFRELGMDPETDPITVVGVGDPSGDVFGNGVLLSKTMRLQAAFNHMHIFLDPDPEPSKSWTERKRLFDAVRGWGDYDRSLLSEGGGIHPRHAKSIRLSPEVQVMLGTDRAEMSGDELCAAILKMEADLLWNGGIGTYFKASHETHRDAGDAANDAVRADAREIRFKVVAEGGNLGFTQAARVEYASAGGRINTDAVDNSGGVDMSDHEVNLKILTTDLERRGDLNREERDKLLLEIALQVSDAVMRNNHDHSLMISLDVLRSTEEMDDFRILLSDLEATGRIDRQRHALPEDGELQRRMRASEGLHRPEIAKVGPFVKMHVYGALVADERFWTRYVERWLFEYFPGVVRKRFKSGILRHQLRKEIAATVITNRLVDALGATHFDKLWRLTGRDVVEIAYASLVAADLLDAWDLFASLRDLDDVRASVEYTKLRHVSDSVAQLAQWLLQRQIDVLEPEAVLGRFRDGFAAYEKALNRIMDRSEKQEVQRRVRYLRNRNIRAEGSERSAYLDMLSEAGEAVLLEETQPDLDVVAAGMLLKRLAAVTQLLKAGQLATARDARDGWESRAIANLRANISELVLDLAQRALEASDEGEEGGAVHSGAIMAATTDMETLSEESGEEETAERGAAAPTRRGVRARVERQLSGWLERHSAVLGQAEALAQRIDNARARGLAPAMVLYGALRPLAG
jgi:glutamate dehydrogenase